MRPKQEPIAPAADKSKTFFYWTLPILFLAALALAVAKLFSPAEINWPQAVLLGIAAMATVGSLTRQLPLQNVLFASVLILLAAAGVLFLDAKTGIPFGANIFQNQSGPKIFSALPWAMPLIWLVAIFNSRGAGRLILRPWRKTKNYGFRLIGLTAVLAALFDFALEPFASRAKHYWLWEPTALPLTWQGAPLVNFFSWAAVTVLILSFATPLLTNKQLSKRAAPDFLPLVIYLGSILFFAIACALQKIWPPVIVDLILIIFTAIFAIRGARW